nr:hypothetical protein [uncultured Albidiferax sp.]
MIDWQIIVNGEYPAGWNEHLDGCWFPDFDMQRFLLPFFDVGDQPVDEYGGTIFDTAAVVRLKTHLLWQRSYIEAKPDSWTVTETTNGGEETAEIKRDEVLRVIDKTIDMATRAEDLKAQFRFRGD